MQKETSQRLSSIKVDLNSIIKKVSNGSIPVVDFPLHIFPERLQEILLDVSHSFGLDKGFLGSAFLLSYGLAIGNSYKLEIKKAQYQKAIIYISFVARPSSNKSQALKFVLSPFESLEAKLRKEYQEEIDEWELWKATPLKDRTDKVKQEPQFKQFILNDSTMEATMMAHQVNKRRIVMYRDELAAFFKDLNKYRSGSDVENFITMWNGGAVKTGRTTRHVYIKDSFISVAGTIQPSVLRDMAKEYLRSGSGFIDRFLFVYPDVQEKPLWNDNEVDPSSISDFEESIFRITDLKQKMNDFGDTESEIVTLKKDARDKLFNWMNYVNKPLTDESNDILAGIYGKFDIHIQRMCLILHFIKWTFGDTEGREKISIDTVESAIILIDFFRSHTNKVQSELSNFDPKSILPDHEFDFYKEIPKNFSVKDIIQIGEKYGKKSQRAIYDFIEKYSPELFKKHGQGNFYKVK
nr:DUF3987 domain-containing protein [Cytophagales bacterium]